MEGVRVFRDLSRTYIADRLSAEGDSAWISNLAVTKDGRTATLSPLPSGALALSFGEGEEEALAALLPLAESGRGELPLPRYLTLNHDDGERLLSAGDDDEIRGLLGQWLALEGGDAGEGRRLLAETDPSGHEAMRIMGKALGGSPVCITHFFATDGGIALRHQRLTRQREIMGHRVAGVPASTCFAVLPSPGNLLAILTDLSAGSAGFYALRHGDAFRQGF